MHASQDTTVGTGQGKMNLYKIRKKILQGYILSSRLFDFCGEYIMESNCWKTLKLETKLLWEVWITLVIRWQDTNGWKTLGGKEPSNDG